MDATIVSLNGWMQNGYPRRYLHVSMYDECVDRHHDGPSTELRRQFSAIVK